MMTRVQPFYRPDGPSGFVSTSSTAGPWGRESQHGGPPAALLARAVGDSVRGEPLVLGKIDVDFLGPIPQGRCEIAVDVLRPGRQVRQVQASMRFPEVADRPAVVARAWLFSAEPGRAPRHGTRVATPELPPPVRQDFFADVDADWGYGPSIEWRFATGGFDDVGAAQVWTRVRVPLVAGEATSDLQRMLVVADSTNGVSAALPMGAWLSIPPSLTVAVVRPPRGEWFLLDARSVIESAGTGLAESVISDQDGLCARVLQPLLVTPRAGA